MKKTSAILLTLVFMLSTLLFGCGQSNNSKSTSGSSGKTTKLTFWTFQELHKKFMDDAVTTWNKAHPDQQIELKVDVYPYDEMHNKLLIALQSGTGAPDLADIEIGKFANYLKGSSPSLVELNSIVEPELKNLIKARLDNYAKDGKYYGIDYHVGATVMFYNKDYMDKAGVNIDSIKTWDDYVAAGKKVVAATGKPMTTVETTEHWSYYPLINQQGSDIFDKDGKVILDNETNTKTLQFLKDMLYKDKIAVPAPGGYHHSEEYWAFMNKGGSASLMMPMWYMGRFTQYMPDLKGKIVIRPIPTWNNGSNGTPGMGGTGTVITKQSKNQDLAKNFLAAAKLSREGSIKTWTLLGFDPIRSDVWDAPEMSVQNEYTDYFGKDIFNTVKSAKDNITPMKITEKFPDAITLVQKNVMFKALKEQSQTPEQALKAAADELRSK